MVSPTPNATLVSGLKKTNSLAIKILVVPSLCFICMMLSLNENLAVYLLGQVLGGIFFTQMFILMHEAGHRSLFKSKKINLFIGYIFSLFTFIPYFNWVEIHELHHKWTGWRDKDPTTEKTFSGRFSVKQEKIINFCWKFYIPLFTIGYRLGIYWKLEKLKRHLSTSKFTRARLEMIIYASFYLFLLSFYPKLYLQLLPAIYLSFIITDIISLSQHSHIEMPVAGQRDISPLKYREQSQYSRSLIFPSWFARYFLFNFNLHEAHHAYPGLACYHLDKVKESYQNSYSFLPWLKKVKAIKGSVFIFSTSKDRKQF